MKKMFIALGIAFALFVSMVIGNTETAQAATDTVSTAESDAYNVMVTYLDNAIHEFGYEDRLIVEDVDVEYIGNARFHSDERVYEFTITGYDTETWEYCESTYMLDEEDLDMIANYF